MKTSPTIILIAALSTNHVIGKDNLLPWNLPADWEHFKSYTNGWPMIQGRTSAQSEEALYSNERNIILSSANKLDLPFEHEIAHSLNEGISRLSDCEQIFIIGGETIFRQSMDLADEMVLTHVEVEVEGDAYFPEFDRQNWTPNLLFRKEPDESHTHAFEVVRWIRV